MQNSSVCMYREEDLEECLQRTIYGTWLRGLICVVPKHGVGDKAEQYCIRNYAVDLYSALFGSSIA